MIVDERLHPCLESLPTVHCHEALALVTHFSTVILFITSLGPSAGDRVTGAEAVDFQRDVQPILAERCLRCHGRDTATLQAGLRLDVRDEALARR